ncbi:hypothetical protein [Bacillus infantis]|uniref:hypothetical protein n=1 Tax=Bacillus infantis TaxID=324767 RepID=UPI00209D85CB|nr:hypothetical protein [Bacillus infantis]MCP1161325.1 hypothetical protein [Bacillus infantis]
MGNSVLEKGLPKAQKFITDLSRYNPYFEEMLKKHKVDLQNFSSLEFNKIPFMDKSTIRENEVSIVTKTKEPVFKEFTTGTTGKPFVCYKTNKERIISSLAIWEERKKRDPEVNIDNFITFFGHDNRIGNPFDFEEENMINCLHNLHSLSPRWICTTITAIKQYAKLIENGKIKFDFNTLKFIELMGEYVEESDRNYVERMFKAKTIVHYGLKETWLLAYECNHRKLHVKKELFYIETIESPLFKSEYGELVVTSYYNFAMPLLRYKTGDFAFIDYKPCACGNDAPIIELIGGRVAGVVKGPKKFLGDMFFKRIMLEIYEKHGDVIDSFQVVQKEINDFEIYIIKKSMYNKEIEELLANLVVKRLGREVKVLFNYVDKIPKKNGKSQLFKCEC